MDLCLSYKSSPLSYYIYKLFKRFSDLCTVIPSVYPSFVRFVLGFTLLFVSMGALAGTLGGFLNSHQTLVNLVTGAIVIFFGLQYLGILKIRIFQGIKGNVDTSRLNFFSAMIFGVIFSISWTPCVGAFLGSALMLASQQGHTLEGMAMLFTYSLGLGLPFLLSTVLIDYLKSAFGWIKRHYSVINTICDCLLILIGILMAAGTLGRWLALLS